MIILKELVEWRLTTECLPTAEAICIGRGPGDRHGECFYNAETRMWCWMSDAPYVEDEAPPKWWAYMPKGPE